MGEQGGCGTALVLVLLVALLFGAGYLLAAENGVAPPPEPDPALAEAQAALAEAQAEVERLRKDNAYLLEAVNHATTAYDTVKLGLEQALAEIKKGEVALAQEKALRIAAEQNPNRFPTTGDERGEVIPTWMGAAAAGIAVGVAVASVVWAWTTRAPQAVEVANLPQRVAGQEEVLVRMTKEEARAFARWKARR